MTPKAAGSTFSMTGDAEHLVRLRKWLRDEPAGRGVPKQEQSNLRGIFELTPAGPGDEHPPDTPGGARLLAVSRRPSPRS